jgi:hypothetical protein
MAEQKVSTAMKKCRDSEKMQHRKLQAVFEPSRKALKELAQKEPW